MLNLISNFLKRFLDAGARHLSGEKMTRAEKIIIWADLLAKISIYFK
jgi:hypothetical protein